MLRLKCFLDCERKDHDSNPKQYYLNSNVFLSFFFFFTQGTKKGIPDTETIPVGLLKMQKVGMYNVVFEIDHGDAVYDFNKFTMEQYNAQLLSLVKWVKTNLGKDL